jgi:hypothetical protein
MPYCTIEEAWNQSLNPEIENDISNSNTANLGYSNIQLEDSELHNKDGDPIRKINSSDQRKKKESRGKRKKKDKKPRIANMSRTYNRLSEHNGPKTRLKDSNKMRYVVNDSVQELDSSDNHPSYDNNDLPINSYNNSMYEELDDEYDKSSNIDKVSMLEDFKNVPNNKFNLLKDENSRLKKIILELQNNKVEDKDNLIDLVVYISTGVIIILMLENITKLIRKF